MAFVQKLPFAGHAGCLAQFEPCFDAAFIALPAIMVKDAMQPAAPDFAQRAVG